MQIGILLFLYIITVVAGLFLFWQMRHRNKKLLSEITNMVHQLRTPLSGVKWALKILLDEEAGRNSEAEQELLTKGFAANERMVALVNDILAVSRLESGTFKYHFVPVQFEKVIEEIIASLNLITSAKGVHINFVSPQQPLPPWNVDAEKMRDVLQNLLDNAIKYTQPGGVVMVTAEVKDGQLHIKVEDNGIGIPDEAKESIFSRFFRAKNAIATETDGSGLGLFMARRIILSHRGKIWFESVTGGGTAFHVLLPQRP